MSGDVDEGPAALLRFVGEYAPGGDTAAADSGRLSIIDIAQSPGRNIIFHGPVRIKVPVLVSNRQQLASTFGCVQHLLCIRGSGSHGLFANDMFAGFHCGTGDLAVLHVGGKYMYCVDFRVLQQFVVIGIHLCVCATVLLACFFGAFCNDITKCIHIDFVRLRRHPGQMLVECNTTTTDESDFQFFHFTGLFSFVLL